MKYCPSCGMQMDDNGGFCQKCGAENYGGGNAVMPNSDETSPKGKRLHCPECGGTRLTAIVESTNNGGVAVSSAVTRRVGVAGYTSNTTHRNYWVCQSCGNKFRNLQNLKEEIGSETKRMKVSIVWAIVSAVFSFICFFGVANAPYMMLIFGPAAFLLAAATILFLFNWSSSKLKVKKLTQEMDYLKTNCFSA